MTLYEIRTVSPEIAAPLCDNSPVISTLNSVGEIAVPLQEKSRVGIAFVGDGAGVTAGVAVG